MRVIELHADQFHLGMERIFNFLPEGGVSDEMLCIGGEADSCKQQAQQDSLHRFVFSF